VIGVVRSIDGPAASELLRHGNYGHVSEDFARRMITFAMHAELAAEAVAEIAQAVARFVQSDAA